MLLLALAVFSGPKVQASMEVPEDVLHGPVDKVMFAKEERIYNPGEEAPARIFVRRDSPGGQTYSGYITAYRWVTSNTGRKTVYYQGYIDID